MGFYWYLDGESRMFQDNWLCFGHVILIFLALLAIAFKQIYFVFIIGYALSIIILMISWVPGIHINLVKMAKHCYLALEICGVLYHLP